MLALYYSPGACSLGPHIALEELGLAHELRRTVLAEGQHLTPEYLAINPRARVPALAFADGRIVTEGPAIMALLNAMRPEAGLLPPAGSWELGKALEWMAWMSSTLHIAYAQIWRPERFLPADGDKAAFSAQGRRNVEARIVEIEAGIVGPWLIGKAYTLADAYLLAFYRWGIRIGLKLEETSPRWTAWKDRMLERPAVLRALEGEGIGTVWEAV